MIEPPQFDLDLWTHGYGLIHDFSFTLKLLSTLPRRLQPEQQAPGVLDLVAHRAEEGDGLAAIN